MKNQSRWPVCRYFCLEGSQAFIFQVAVWYCTIANFTSVTFAEATLDWPKIQGTAICLHRWKAFLWLTQKSCFQMLWKLAWISLQVFIAFICVLDDDINMVWRHLKQFTTTLVTLAVIGNWSFCSWHSQVTSVTSQSHYQDSQFSTLFWSALTNQWLNSGKIVS